MGADEKRYNGWTNYETWCVKLWIDNDEGEYEMWREAAREAWSEAEHSGNEFVERREGRARILLVGRLKDYFDEQAPETVGVYADLLNAALGEVDWYEIAQAMLDDEREAGTLDDAEADDENSEADDDDTGASA